jgi:inorganic triphosphatase YgiF
MMEIELKLSLDTAQVAKFRRLGLLQGARPVTRHLHSVYLDTPAWDLMRRGIALRVRKAGGQWLQTLKAEAPALGALTQRPEWEVELARGHHDLSRLPEEATALLQGLDTERIVPAFVTDFRRTTWLVEHGGAQMEVAVDLGEIQAGKRVLPLSEVEIELKAGPREALFDLALALLEHVPLGVEPRSKAARGYALAGAVTPAPVKAVLPRLDADMPAGQSWVMLAQAALAQVMANLPGFLVAPEEREYLHQLRIGLRRLRVMAGLAVSLGREGPGWDKGLKDVMQALNGARDWDVLLHETLPRLEAILQDPPLGRPLRLRLWREAQAARERAQATVASPAFTRLVLEMGRDLLVPPATTQALGPWAAACLESRWQDVLERGRGFDGLDAARRHRLRIAAKGLRYTADMLGSLFPGQDKFMRRLAKLQDHLGALQDNVVACRLLTGLGTRSPAMGFDAGRLVGCLAWERAARGGGKAWRALVRCRPFWRVKTGEDGIRSGKH